MVGLVLLLLFGLDLVEGYLLLAFLHYFFLLHRVLLRQLGLLVFELLLPLQVQVPILLLVLIIHLVLILLLFLDFLLVVVLKLSVEFLHICVLEHLHAVLE